MSKKLPTQEINLDKKEFHFAKMARDQDDIPDPESIQGIISLKAHGTTNLEKIESYDSTIFILSQNSEGKMIVSFLHSLNDEKSNDKKKNEVGRCLLFTSNECPPLPVVFDPEKLFSKKSFKKESLPPVYKIVSRDNEKDWKDFFNELPDRDDIQFSEKTIKPGVIITPLLAESFFLSSSTDPATILNKFLDTLEKNTEFLNEKSKSKLPAGLEEIIHFLFLAINNQVTKVNFNEMEETSKGQFWLESLLPKFLFPSSDIENFIKNEKQKTEDQEETDDQDQEETDDQTKSNSNKEKPPSEKAKDRSTSIDSNASSSSNDNDESFKSILMDQEKISKKLTEQVVSLTTTKSMDPALAPILQSIALIASNSNMAQLESSKFLKTMARSLKLQEKRDKAKYKEQKGGKWEKLDSSIKSLLLVASMDGLTIPTEPTQSL